MQTRIILAAAVAFLAFATSQADARRAPSAQAGGMTIHTNDGKPAYVRDAVYYHRKASRSRNRATSRKAVPAVAAIPIPKADPRGWGPPVVGAMVGEEFEPPRAARPDLVAAMRKDLGRNPTGWGSRWCARYLDMVLRRLGYRSVRGNANLASDYRSIGQPVSPNTKGAIIFTWRSGGGHVSVYTGDKCKGGALKTISGNSTGRVVNYNCVARGRVVAWRAPVLRQQHAAVKP